MGDVGIVGGPGGQPLHRRADGIGEVGQQRHLDERGEIGEHVGGRDALLQARGGRRLHGRAVAARLDERHGELGVPAHAPRLAERARRAATVVGFAPRHPDGEQPVEQVRAGPPSARAQVELERAFGRLGLQADSLLLGEQIASEGNHRRRVGHRTQPVADDQLVVDQGERARPAVSEHGEGGVEHLFEPGRRPAP